MDWSRLESLEYQGFRGFGFWVVGLLGFGVLGWNATRAWRNLGRKGDGGQRSLMFVRFAMRTLAALGERE